MNRLWRVEDKGTTDKMSVVGYTAPSWSRFTRRSWVRSTVEGWHRLVLRNMSNDWSYKVPFRGSEYQVRLFDQDGNTLLILTGTNWQDLVGKAKDWSYNLVPG